MILATPAQAQLFIEIYPSQDNANQTLWFFSGESIAHHTSTIRSSGNYHRRDSWKLATPTGSAARFYGANKPTNAFFNLTPLFGSTNTTDIESVRTRFWGSPGSYSSIFSTNTLWLPYTATNPPTITNGIASKTIAKMFMNASNASDEMGIRHAGGGNLWYTTR